MRLFDQRAASSTTVEGPRGWQAATVAPSPPEGPFRRYDDERLVTDQYLLPHIDAIVLHGSARYRAQVQALLFKISETPIGRRTLARIFGAPRKVLVRTLVAETGERLEPERTAEVQQWVIAENRPAVGEEIGQCNLMRGLPIRPADGLVLFEPDDWPNERHPNTPPDAVLFHELFHASLAAWGHGRSCRPRGGWRWKRWWSFEEIDAVSAENSYRRQAGIRALRRSHAHLP